MRATSSEAIGTPIASNPFHADIVLPSDNGKDFIMDVTRMLPDKADLELFEAARGFVSPKP